MAVASIYAPIVSDTPISFEYAAPSVAAIERRIRKTVESLPWLVAEVDGVVVGYAYASPHRERAAYLWSVDTSVYVAERAWRRGVGRSLYEVLLGELSRLGYVSAYAGITLPNDASVALHEAVGFRSVGVFPAVGYKLGRWHDVGWWHQLLTEPPDEPVPPTAVA